MTDLPQPSIPVGDSTAAMQSLQAANTTSQPPQQIDEKMVQEKAIEQIEDIILKTAGSPSQRADEIHAVKNAYLKARFGVELKDRSSYA